MTKRLRKKYLKIYAHILPDLLPSLQGQDVDIRFYKFYKTEDEINAKLDRMGHDGRRIAALRRMKKQIK